MPYYAKTGLSHSIVAWLYEYLQWHSNYTFLLSTQAYITPNLFKRLSNKVWSILLVCHIHSKQGNIQALIYICPAIWAPGDNGRHSIWDKWGVIGNTLGTNKKIQKSNTLGPPPITQPPEEKQTEYIECMLQLWGIGVGGCSEVEELLTQQ